jgi:hypothetical protein
MKKINCNDWAPRNKPVPYEEAAPIPITNPLIVPIAHNKLFYNFYFYHDGGPARFYNRLVGVVLYSFLDQDNYNLLLLL